MHLRVNYYVYFVNIGQMTEEYTAGASQARDTLDVHMQKGLDARIIHPQLTNSGPARILEQMR